MRHNHGLRAQSGIPWTPSLINSALWLDASDTASVTTVSGAVSQINDKSGNARHATQATASNRPLYSAAAQNGRNVIAFDGANDFLELASTALFSSGNAELTILCAYKANETATAGAYGQIFGNYNAGNFGIYIGKGSPAYLEPWGIWNGADLDLDSGSYQAQGQNWLISAVRRSGFFTGWTNGHPKNSVSNSNSVYAGSGSSSAWRLGSNSVTGEVAAYDLFEIICFNEAISDDVRQTVEGYLAHKWGLTSSLPAYHPYKTSAPLAGSQNFDNVSLLLSGDGTNGAQNNTFIDSSGNGRSVTRGGNITQGSFSPYGPKSGSSYDPALHGGSAYFDGSGDFVTLGGLTSTYLSGDFTIEGWVWLENKVSQMFFNTIPHASFGISLNRDGSGQTSLYIGNGTSWLTLDFRSSETIPLYAWSHVAVVRSSNAITIYHNGVAQGTTTANMPSGYGQTAYVGTYDGGTGENSKGYISDYRITRSAVYTSNFTPPTAPVSAIANTEVLLRFTNGGVFDSAGKSALETVGNAQVSTTQKKFGTGALYFDGTDDAVQVPQSSALTFPGPFTIECWVYLNALPNNFTAFLESINFNNEDAQWCFGISSANKLMFYYHYPSRAVSNSYNVSSASLTAGVWTHCAISREASGACRLFINGTQDGSFTESGFFYNVQPNPYQIGRSKVNWSPANSPAFPAGSYLNGYIDDLRITKGVARYTANFTPPSSAFPLS